MQFEPGTLVKLIESTNCIGIVLSTRVIAYSDSSCINPIMGVRVLWNIVDEDLQRLAGHNSNIVEVADAILQIID
jgi:hypothetical protein